MLKVTRLDSGETCDVPQHTFAGGEEHVRIVLPFGNGADFRISARIDSSREVMRLLLLTELLRREYPDSKIELLMPYLPYARQDRACVVGDSFSLKVFTALINAQGYNRVYIADAHSIVSTALLGNVYEFKQYAMSAKVMDKCPTIDFVVAPDVGAAKKTDEWINEWNLRLVEASKVRKIQAFKQRDVDGNITSTTVDSDNLDGARCLIVDDICDGGRTFVELSKVLKEKGAAEVYLYVTHGIFSNGVNYLINNGISHIYTTDSMTGYSDEFPNVTTVYRFFNFQ